MTKEIYHEMWDYFGACDPLNNKTYPGQKTFTLGCFQWVKKSNGRGFKKGKVQHRIKGYVHTPEAAHHQAKLWCDKKNQDANE